MHAGIRVLLSAGIAHVGPDRQEEILKTNFAGGLLISIFRLFKANLKFMKCPTCHETLLLSDKNGIEIDYCPACRGIWLDRGELEKIIERSAEHYSNRDNYGRDRNQYGYDERRNPDYNRRPHKKKSFLGDLFDFD